MSDAVEAHDPATEAAAAIDDPTVEVRVLEPSPPAVAAEPFLADDPADPASTGGLPVIAPHSAGDRTWDDVIAERAELAEFASARWLGSRRQLPELPGDYASSLIDFHRVAFAVVAEARWQANGKFGLRYTRGGFGTPFFADDAQVRVAGDLLILQESGSVRAAPIRSLRQAAEFAGIEPGSTAAEHDSPKMGDVDRLLDIRAEVGDFLGEWFGLATAVLEELRHTSGGVDPERIQLWPGHFDPAMAVGDADTGGRAAYGFSPGDHAHPEPYVYIGAGDGVDRSDPFWNEDVFAGASLSFRDLAATDDHYGAALTFVRDGYRRLNS